MQYDPKEAQVALLRREVELLRHENGYLKEQLRLGQGGAGGSMKGAQPGEWRSKAGV